MENKKLKKKLDNFKRKYQKHLCQLIISKTDQRKISPFMRLFWEEQQKYLQSSQNNATYHPMNPDTGVYISDNQFI